MKNNAIILSIIETEKETEKEIYSLVSQKMWRITLFLGVVGVFTALLYGGVANCLVDKSTNDINKTMKRFNMDVGGMIECFTHDQRCWAMESVRPQNQGGSITWIVRAPVLADITCVFRLAKLDVEALWMGHGPGGSTCVHKFVHTVDLATDEDGALKQLSQCFLGTGYYEDVQCDMFPIRWFPGLYV